MHATVPDRVRPDPNSISKSDLMDLAAAGVLQRSWKKTRAASTTASATLPDDVVLEILGRVADDHAVAALFRCAVACKRWLGLVSDPSFLGGRSPDPSSSLLLLGFFAQNRPYRPRTVSEDPLPGARSPAFVPAPRSPLGPGRRSLASFVSSGAPGSHDDLDDAEPLVARHGLLLVRLASPRYGAPVDDVGAGRTHVHLAVCNLLAGTCEVLPPLKCRASSSINSCTIVTDADSCSPPGRRSPGAFFNVLVIVFNSASQNYYLCTYSSAASSWSTPPTRCFSHVYVGLKDGGAAVCQGMASWLARDKLGSYILDVCVESGHVSVTDIPVPQDHDGSAGDPLLAVAADGTLSMFREDACGRLEIWTLQGGGGDDDEESGVDDDADVCWLLAKVVELNPPTLEGMTWLCVGERSGTLLVMDTIDLYVVDLEAGAMEEVTEQFRRLDLPAVPFEMDWLTFFSSRLEGTRGKLRDNP